MTYTFDKIEKSPSSQFRVRITVTLRHSWFERLCGLTDATHTFEGSGTVWYYTNPVERAEPSTERILQGMEMRAEIEGFHPAERGLIL